MKLLVLFFYFVTAPYAGPSVYLTNLFLNNGLGKEKRNGF